MVFELQKLKWKTLLAIRLCFPVFWRKHLRPKSLNP